MVSFHGLRPSDLSRVLHITLRDVKYPVSELELHQVFHPYGSTMVRFCTSTSAVIAFPTMSQATRAGLEMQGRCIYTNCCWMQIQFTPEQVTASAIGTAARASQTPAPTTVAAPRPASISAASAGATPAPVCVLASPAPSPSSLTAADEEKPVMASWAELQAKLERVLAKIAPLDDQDAAATSSPSTTTSSPPTAPLHATPPATITEAATNTTTLRLPTAAVPALAMLDESAMDHLRKLHVVHELSMPAHAKCSTECQDILSQQCKAASVGLAITNAFTPVQKAAVLAATRKGTASPFHSIDGTAGMPAPAAGVPAAAIRVPPRPPDLHVPVHEDYDAIKVMESSLLAEDARKPIPEQEKALLASMILQLLRVASKLPMTCSVQQKEGDEERPMPWPSFVFYWPLMSALKPRQPPQGITLKLLIEDMQTVLRCLVSWYPLPICSDGSVSCFQCLFTGCQRMVVQCLTLVPSVNPAVSSPWRPPDRATHKAMLPCIQSVFFYVMAQLQWEIAWPPHGVGGTLSLWETYYSGAQLQQMCSRQFDFVRKNCVAKFCAQPASASVWKSAFQFCWKLQANTPCHGIQWVAKKQYRILPCIGRNTYCTQYKTYQADLATTPLAIVAVSTNSYVAQFLMIWDPGITERMEVHYYPGNRITGKYFCSLELYVKSKVDINGVTILWIELPVYSTCVPWNPDLHTWLWCCCGMHNTNSIYGCDLVEQSCTSSSWQLKAWINTFRYIKYAAEIVNQIAEEILMRPLIKVRGNSLIGKFCLGFLCYPNNPCNTIGKHT